MSFHPTATKIKISPGTPHEEGLEDLRGTDLETDHAVNTGLRPSLLRRKGQATAAVA
jgi:hypothetical protein